MTNSPTPDTTAQDDMPLEAKIKYWTNDHLISVLSSCWAKIEHYRFTANYEPIYDLQHEYGIYLHETYNRMDNYSKPSRIFL